jgi:hypothetical protein
MSNWQHPKIRSVSVTEEYLLQVEFIGGERKIYDLRRWSDHPAFVLLFRHPAFIKSVRIEPGGYGISWNDDIDLDAEELWLNGTNLDLVDLNLFDAGEKNKEKIQ